MAFTNETGGTMGQSPSQEKRVEDINTAIRKMASGGTPTGKQTSANPRDPLVFLGYKTSSAPGTAGFYGATKSTTPMERIDQTATLTEVTNQYFTWDQKTKDKFLSQLALTGRDVTGLADAQIASLWGAYAQQAAAYMSAGQKLTPWDIIAKDMRQRESFLKTPRTVKQTSTDVQLSTSEDARAIFMQAAQSLLGRDPTKAESKTFQAALNAYEEANPRTTTSTQQFMGDELQSQDQTTTGGVTAEARGLLAMEDIKKDPEYGAHQAATNGMNWLMEMVQGG